MPFLWKASWDNCDNFQAERPSQKWVMRENVPYSIQLGWRYQMAFYQKQLKDSEFGAEHVLKGKLPNVAMESFFRTLNLKCFHTC